MTTPEHGNKLNVVTVAGLMIPYFSCVGKSKRNICSETEEFMEVNEVILRSDRSRREPMDFERLKFILYFVAGMTAMVLGFVALYMVIYFAGA